MHGSLRAAPAMVLKGSPEARCPLRACACRKHLSLEAASFHTLPLGQMPAYLLVEPNTSNTLPLLLLDGVLRVALHLPGSLTRPASRCSDALGLRPAGQCLKALSRRSEMARVGFEKTSGIGSSGTATCAVKLRLEMWFSLKYSCTNRKQSRCNVGLQCWAALLGFALEGKSLRAVNLVVSCQTQNLSQAFSVLWKGVSTWTSRVGNLATCARLGSGNRQPRHRSGDATHN